MSYSPEVQAKIDAKAAAQRAGGPSWAMARLRHNGETGEWVIRELNGDKLADETTPFQCEGATETQIKEDGKKTRKGLVGGSWRGIVVRVAFMSQAKWKQDAVAQKMTREFTDFKNEPIELLRRVFGPAGQTTVLKTFANYQEFKEATMLKDEEGNPAGSAYDLKACLYVYHPVRKDVIKFVCGGSARSEWFEYVAYKASGNDGVVTVPFHVKLPSAKLLEEVLTEFVTTEAVNKKKMTYHRVSFNAISLLDEATLQEAWDIQGKLDEWVNAWKVINAMPSKSFGEQVMADAQVAHESAPLPRSAARALVDQAGSDDDEIDVSQIPF